MKADIDYTFLVAKETEDIYTALVDQVNGNHFSSFSVALASLGFAIQAFEAYREENDSDRSFYDFVGCVIQAAEEASE